MNKYKACNILNISIDHTKTELKQAFRLNALKYHPDKSFSNTNSHFIKIHEAYKYLSNDTTEYTYNKLLQDFISYFGNENFFILTQLFKKLCDHQINYCIHFFEQLDVNSSYNMYALFSKYNDIFKIPDNLMDSLEQILKKKTHSNNIYIIRPSIDDLFESNIFKLVHNSNIFYVPMWHEEIYYDHNGFTITAKCIPNLPNYIMIDEKNNIHVSVTKNIIDILNTKVIDINISKKLINIEVEKLYIKTHQTIIYKNKGISIINQIDMYNDTKKSDIIVHLTLI